MEDKAMESKLKSYKTGKNSKKVLALQILR
jgi:hypothetical protein